MKRKNIWAIAVTAASAILYSACDDSTSASNEPVPASSASDVVNSSTSQETPAGNSSAVEETSSSSAVFVEDVPPANGCGDLWCGLEEIEGHVETGSKDDTGGWWYSFNDQPQPLVGDSWTEFPNDIDFAVDIFGAMAEGYSGIPARMIIGTSIEKPFAGLGFNLVSEDLKAMDVNDWKGVCLTYSSTVPFQFRVGKESDPRAEGVAGKYYTVPKAQATTVINIPWESLKTEEGGDVDTEAFLKSATNMKLVFNESGDLFLYSIGRYGTCGKDGDTVSANYHFKGSANPSSSSSVQKTEVDSTFHWVGSMDKEGKVITGSPEETSGYWYDYTDSYQNGNSEIIYPSDVEVEDFDNFFGPLNVLYDGIKAEVKIGDAYESPFAGFGFNIWSEDQEGKDISKWGGFCLTYSSTGPFYIELGLQDEADLTEYHNFQSSVSASETVTTVNVPWSKFKMRAAWGPGAGPLEDYIDKVAAVKLKFEKSSDFLLKEIGSLDACGN